MKKILCIMLMLAATVMSINYVVAATTTYTCTPMADTRLDSATPTTNYGTATTLKLVGTGAGGPVRSIIRLNIPPFISASQIQSAYLNVYGGSSGAASLAIDIHPVTPPSLWFEKDLLKPDLVTQIAWGATWNDYGGTASGLAWVTPGGDYDAGSSASATIVAGWNNIDITTLLANNLDTIRKYGMLMKLQDEALNAFKNVNSRDNSSNQPYLQLNVDLGLSATTYMCPNVGDVYMDESLVDGDHNLNFNWKTRILVGRHSTKGKTRGLWKFEIPAGILPEDIKCAVLYLSGCDHAFKTNQFVVDLYALEVPLKEEKASWDESDTGVPWTTPGGDYDASVVSSGTIPQTLLGDPAYNWRAEIDVTDLLAGNLVKVRNNGILMKLQEETGANTNQNIASREAYDDSDVAAYLLIDLADTDTDTVCDTLDNCPNDANAGQEDNESDGSGDVCDPDDDNDTVLDVADNCPLIANTGQEDEDADDMGTACDNCSSMPNGSALGTCVKLISGMMSYTGVTCSSDGDCAAGATCDLVQGDCNSNGCGDACECYADIAGTTGKVDLSDLVVMKGEFSQPCPPSLCTADLNGDNKVDLSDLVLMKTEFNRSGCPACS